MPLIILLVAAGFASSLGVKSKSGSMLLLHNQSALELEHQAFALFAGRNTPELAELKQQMVTTVQNEMKPAVMANFKKVQEQVDAAAKKGNTCAAKALEEAAEYKIKFFAAKDAHAKCRDEESTMVGKNTACSTESTTLSAGKKSQCDAVTALEKGQSNAAKSCATESDESYVAQMERLRDHFAAKISEYNNQKDLCSSTTSTAEQKAAECKSLETSYADKKTSCNQAQATMDSSSCAYSEAVTVACETCFKDAATSYESGRSAFAAEQDSMRQEMKAILRITCYLNSLDSTDKSAAMSACASQDHSSHAEVMKIALTYPTPLTASCPEPEGIAGSAKYEASVYGVLPSDAPAESCAASCCGVKAIDGWVLVMKISKADSSTFGFSSSLWTNTELLNEKSPTAAEEDAKYAPFTDEPFKEVRMCIGSPASNCVEHRFSSQYESIRSLFSSGYVRDPSVDQDAILRTFAPQKGSYQECGMQRPGFNIQCHGGFKARWGYCNNCPAQGCQLQDNNDADGSIGIGLAGHGNQFGAGWTAEFAPGAGLCHATFKVPKAVWLWVKRLA
mmetsp:Transcript_42355/g.78941  ORF Transcript_42355/g.78941 Transcript_42355/m.78941 type:complete len:563 (+) Transcript_42355:62-1750(+)